MNRCPTVPKHGGKVIKEHEKTINKKVNTEIARRGKGGGGELERKTQKIGFLAEIVRKYLGFLQAKNTPFHFREKEKTRKKKK